MGKSIRAQARTHARGKSNLTLVPPFGSGFSNRARKAEHGRTAFAARPRPRAFTVARRPKGYFLPFLRLSTWRACPWQFSAPPEARTATHGVLRIPKDVARHPVPFASVVASSSRVHSFPFRKGPAMAARQLTIASRASSRFLPRQEFQNGTCVPFFRLACCARRRARHTRLRGFRMNTFLSEPFIPYRVDNSCPAWEV